MQALFAQVRAQAAGAAGGNGAKPLPPWLASSANGLGAAPGGVKALKGEEKALGGPGLLFGLTADLKGGGFMSLGAGREDRKEFKNVLALGAKVEDGEEPAAKRLKPDPEAVVEGDVDAGVGGAGGSVAGGGALEEEEEQIVWEDVDLIGAEHHEEQHEEEGGPGLHGEEEAAGGGDNAAAGEGAADFDDEEWEDV